MDFESVKKEKKSSIVAEFGGKPKNTGSIEAQIELITEEINDFISIAPSRGISVTIKKGNYKPIHLLFKQP